MKTFQQYLDEAVRLRGFKSSQDQQLEEFIALVTKHIQTHYPVTFSAEPINGAVHVRELSSRAQGAGSQALQDIVNFADQHQVTLSLFPVPYEQPSNSQLHQRLERWYQRYGFEPSTNIDLYIRHPAVSKANV